VHLHRREVRAALANCHEFDLSAVWHVLLVVNMEEKSVHGRASQREKTLAEAEDYSRVKRNVNRYFLSGLICFRVGNNVGSVSTGTW